jgi:hypothetical protein
MILQRLRPQIDDYCAKHELGANITEACKTYMSKLISRELAAVERIYYRSAGPTFQDIDHSIETFNRLVVERLPKTKDRTSFLRQLQHMYETPDSARPLLLTAKSTMPEYRTRYMANKEAYELMLGTIVNTLFIRIFSQHAALHPTMSVSSMTLASISARYQPVFVGKLERAGTRDVDVAG